MSPVSNQELALSVLSNSNEQKRSERQKKTNERDEQRSNESSSSWNKQTRSRLSDPVAQTNPFTLEWSRGANATGHKGTAAAVRGYAPTCHFRVSTRLFDIHSEISILHVERVGVVMGNCPPSLSYLHLGNCSRSYKGNQCIGGRGGCSLPSLNSLL